MDDEIEELRRRIDESKNTVAITGAGILVSSGGLTFDESDSAAMTEMMAIGSEEVLRNDPERYCAW